MDFIDLRSDTVTWPTKEMREAMSKAVVGFIKNRNQLIIGDDVFAEDPTVNELEIVSAKMLGKEAALFVPTGCMANQICILYQSNKSPKGSEILLADECHIIQFESSTTAYFARCQTRPIRAGENGLTAELLEKEIRIEPEDDHQPITALIVLENASTIGTVMKLEQMKAIYNLGKKYNIPIHLDGARIFNAAAALGVEAKEIAQYTDTLMFCISKGLGAPGGSLVVGTKEFVQEARRLRKLFGGGMRQCGLLAAAGLISFKQILPQIPTDNKMAYILGQQLSKFQQIKVLMERLQVNMLFFIIPQFTLEDIQKFGKFLLEKKIKISLPFDTKVPFKFIMHHYIREKEIEFIVKSFAEFFEQQ